MGSPRGTMKLELPTIGNRFADDRRQPPSPLATPLTGGASPVDLLTKRKKWLVEPPRLRGDDKDPGVVGHEVFFNSAFGFSFGILKVSQFIIDDRYHPELKGSIAEGPNHSNHSNHSNSFK